MKKKILVAGYWLMLVIGVCAVLVVGAFKVGGYNVYIETEGETHQRMINASLEAEAEYNAMLQRNLDYIKD